MSIILQELIRFKNNHMDDRFLLELADQAALGLEVEKLKGDQEYEILGIMHSVDKWLTEEQLEEHKDNPAHRAAMAREIALRAIEDEAVHSFNMGLHQGAELALAKWMHMEYDYTPEEQTKEAEKLTGPSRLKPQERNEL